MTCAHRKALVKLLRGLNHRHNLYTVFADFVEMAAIAMARLDILQAAEREQRYLRTIAKYEPDEQKEFPKMFGELVAAMDLGPADVLGAVFGELELGNKAAGQFFTPYSLCSLMARMIVGDGADMREKVAERGYITASEPACGAGAQIIALAEAMQAAGINYQQHLHVIAVDVDSRAAHMAYLQLSLLHIPAVVVVGNTLSLEEREHWYTPAHILGLWDAKLRRGFALGSRLDARPTVPAPVPRADVDLGEQLALFDTRAA